MTRRETILRMAKGFRGRAKNCFKLAIRRVEKGLLYSYKERRAKKRVFRKEWIQQLGAGSREYGLSYSKFIHALGLADIGLNRKMLSTLAREEPYSFRAIVEEAKAKLKEAILKKGTDPAPPPSYRSGLLNKKGAVGKERGWYPSRPGSVAAVVAEGASLKSNLSSS